MIKNDRVMKKNVFYVLKTAFKMAKFTKVKALRLLLIWIIKYISQLFMLLMDFSMKIK